MGSSQYESEFDKLQERTNETIRRVTRTVQRLGERNQHFQSRWQDYLYLAEWFDSLSDISEAHKLSSVAFGVFYTKHLLADPALTEDIYTDVWHALASVHETVPRIVNYGEKTKAGAVVEHREAKEQQLREHLQQRQREQDILEHYVQGNQIQLSDLTFVETPIRLPVFSQKVSGDPHAFDMSHDVGKLFMHILQVKSGFSAIIPANISQYSDLKKPIKMW